jgi:hypothetical protein
MMPLFSYTTGIGGYGRYYPRGFYPPRTGFYHKGCPPIVRPRANNTNIRYNNTNTTNTKPITQQMIINQGKATNIIKTGF